MHWFDEALLKVHPDVLSWPARYLIGLSLRAYPSFETPHIGEPHQLCDVLQLI